LGLSRNSQISLGKDDRGSNARIGASQFGILLNSAGKGVMVWIAYSPSGREEVGNRLSILPFAGCVAKAIADFLA